MIKRLIFGNKRPSNYYLEYIACDTFKQKESHNIMKSWVDNSIKKKESISSTFMSDVWVNEGSIVQWNNNKETHFTLDT